MSKVNTAPIKWAQRSDSLYITIALPGECRTYLSGRCCQCRRSRRERRRQLFIATSCGNINITHRTSSYYDKLSSNIYLSMRYLPTSLPFCFFHRCERCLHRPRRRDSQIHGQIGKQGVRSRHCLLQTSRCEWVHIQGIASISTDARYEER